MADGFIPGNTDWNPYEYTIGVTIRVPTTDYSSYDDIELAPIQIDGFFIEKDYDMDNLPVFLLDVAIPEEIDQRIRRSINKMKTENVRNETSKDKKKKKKSRYSMRRKSERTSTKTTFTVSVYGIVKDEPGERDSTCSKKVIMQGNYLPVSTNSSISNYKKYYRELKEAQGEDDDDASFELHDRMNRKTYILVDEKTATMCRTIVNGVAVKATLTSAITHLFTVVGAKNQVLMSNLDNVTEYNELLLLPIPLIAQLYYLNNYYGFHTEGTQIFFDFDRVYVLRQNGKFTAWSNNEIKEVDFVIQNSTDTTFLAKGVKEDGGQRIYMAVDQDGYDIQNVGNMADQITGKNALVLDEKESSSDFVDTGGAFYKIQLTKNNQYVSNWIQLRATENECIIQLACSDIDISQLTPNKEYKVLSDNTEIAQAVAGNYRLSRVQTTMMKKEEHFLSVTLLTLKRVSTA